MVFINLGKANERILREVKSDMFQRSNMFINSDMYDGAVASVRTIIGEPNTF